MLAIQGGTDPADTFQIGIKYIFIWMQEKWIQPSNKFKDGVNNKKNCIVNLSYIEINGFHKRF